MCASVLLLVFAAALSHPQPNQQKNSHRPSSFPATSLIIPRNQPRESGRPGPEALMDKPLPHFKLPRLTGGTLTNSKLKGKVAIIDFWASWCGPCKMASPIMQELHRKYKSKGLIVLGANTSERKDGVPVKSKEFAAEYVAEHHYTYPMVYGSDDFKNACKVSGIPTILVVDKRGIVRLVQVGFAYNLQEILEKTITPLL